MCVKLIQSGLSHLSQEDAYWTCHIYTLLRDFTSLQISQQSSKDDGNADLHKSINYLRKATAILSEENVSIEWELNTKSDSILCIQNDFKRRISVNNRCRAWLLPQLVAQIPGRVNLIFQNMASFRSAWKIMQDIIFSC